MCDTYLPGWAMCSINQIFGENTLLVTAIKNVLAEGMVSISDHKLYKGNYFILLSYYRVYTNKFT